MINPKDINLKELKILSLKIANESASEDPRDNSWWGHDTEIGNLPQRIQDHIKQFLSDKLNRIEKEIDENKGKTEVYKEFDMGLDKSLQIIRKEFTLK